MDTKEKAIEWFEFLKEKFIDTEYEIYLDLAINALKPMQVNLVVTKIAKHQSDFSDLQGD